VKHKRCALIENGITVFWFIPTLCMYPCYASIKKNIISGWIWYFS